MSIIERIAELLEPGERLNRRFPEPEETAERLELNAIERQISGDDPTALSSRQTVVAEPSYGAPAGELRSVEPHPGATASRMLKIDREVLRQRNIITPDHRRTPTAEAFRRIKRRILLNVSHPEPGAQPNLVMVTSSVPDEGKTFCAINLAFSIALERDHTVVLVDGDVTRPSISAQLEVPVGRGWMDVLLDRHVKLSDVLCNTDIERLLLLPAGTSHPHVTELLASDAMRTLLRELSARDPNRVVIFDAPPLLAASEAAVLAGQVGQVVVVVEAGKTPEAALRSALGRIESSNVVGLVLNKAGRASLWDGYGEYGYDGT